MTAYSGLAYTYLVVSVATLTYQTYSFTRLVRNRAIGAPKGELSFVGLRRTIACRVGVSILYVVVAVSTLVMGSIPGIALAVYSAAQGVWLYNSYLDLRLQRRMRPKG